MPKCIVMLPAKESNVRGRDTLMLPAKGSSAFGAIPYYFQQKTVHADHAPTPYIGHQRGRSHPFAWTVHTNTPYIAHNGHWCGRSFARNILFGVSLRTNMYGLLLETTFYDFLFRSNIY